MRVKKNHSLLGNARELRRNMTPQELKLWYQFLRPYPLKFYKQRIIDSYIVDFYCAAARLVIEIDGSQHYTQDGRAKDEGRSAMLERYDLQVLRFSNREINVEFDAVCQMIHQRILERTNTI
ncbi:MAG: endonuclease domain-containing protein [Ruminiclostridium sp.]|nr:endonuclease domain-containing protein [Ruminiclostridium sp.]